MPQRLSGCVLHHQLDEADRATRVVVDVQVLDVDPDLAHVGEQPGQLAGVVGHRDEHRGGRDRRPAVLAGDGLGAVDATGRGSPRASSSSSLASTSTSRARSACTSRRISLTAAWLARMIWPHMSGSPAGDAGHVAHALAGEREVLGLGLGELARR